MKRSIVSSSSSRRRSALSGWVTTAVARWGRPRTAPVDRRRSSTSWSTAKPSSSSRCAILSARRGINDHRNVDSDTLSTVGDDIEERIRAHNSRTLLRFVMCGSVDDGKSTLIGRLLYESGSLLTDQLATLESDSRIAGTQGEE